MSEFSKIYAKARQKVLDDGGDTIFLSKTIKKDGDLSEIVVTVSIEYGKKTQHGVTNSFVFKDSEDQKYSFMSNSKAMIDLFGLFHMNEMECRVTKMNGKWMLVPV